MVRYESVITAVIGGLLGTAIGLLFAFLVTRSLDDLGLGFALPLGQLLIFLLLAVAVGVIAAVGPARRGPAYRCWRPCGRSRTASAGDPGLPDHELRPVQEGEPGAARRSRAPACPRAPPPSPCAPARARPPTPSSCC